MAKVQTTPPITFPRQRSDDAYIDTNANWLYLTINSRTMPETKDNMCAMRSLESTEIPSEVREFCARKQIHDELKQTVVLAKRHFAMAGEPRYQVVNDPECGEHYVSIHIQAEGQPEEVFQQSEAFLDMFLASIDRSKQNYINLVYHSVQE